MYVRNNHILLILKDYYEKITALFKTFLLDTVTSEAT